MPSDLSFWLISVPLHDGDPASILADVRKATGNSVPVGGWEIPELQVGDILPSSSSSSRGTSAVLWVTHMASSFMSLLRMDH